MVAILEEDSISEGQQTLLNSNGDTIHVQKATQPPPNPRNLWEVIHEVVVQPKGFGGSSGFSQKYIVIL